MPPREGGGGVPPHVVMFAPRERARAMARSAFPRRRAKLVTARHAAAFAEELRRTLVDAAVVDLSDPTEESWQAAALAREYPSVPFFAVTAMRTSDAPTVARCVALDFVELLVDGVDDVGWRDLILPRGYTARFAAALREPPAALAITTPFQRVAWQQLVAHGGRAVRTEALAAALGVTREHLSRTFAASGAPNLKRVIDLVRLIAAAELAKNPGYDVGDVARVLGFASSSHLSSAAQRVVGTKPGSLSRLRTVDLVERFVKGRGRSRGQR